VFEVWCLVCLFDVCRFSVFFKIAYQRLLSRRTLEPKTIIIVSCGYLFSVFLLRISSMKANVEISGYAKLCIQAFALVIDFTLVDSIECTIAHFVLLCMINTSALFQVLYCNIWEHNLNAV
jgi:hypothetical protein